MGLFNTTRSFTVSESFIPYAMNRIRETFEEKGYRFNIKSESYDRTIVEIQRGNVLLQIAGLRRGLEIVFTKNRKDIDVEARACLLENHLAGPAIIALAIPKIRIPLAVTDGIGLIFEIGLDEEAISVIDEAYEAFTGKAPIFCTHCGAQIHREDGVCEECGFSAFSETAAVSG